MSGELCWSPKWTRRRSNSWTSVASESGCCMSVKPVKSSSLTTNLRGWVSGKRLQSLTLTASKPEVIGSCLLSSAMSIAESSRVPGYGEGDNISSSSSSSSLSLAHSSSASSLPNRGDPMGGAGGPGGGHRYSTTSSSSYSSQRAPMWNRKCDSDSATCLEFDICKAKQQHIPPPTKNNSTKN